MFVIIATTTPMPANAFSGNYFWFPNNMHVRIRHVSSGLYLGIAPDGNEVNGARIQLQRYNQGDQMQIFYLKAIARDSNGRIQYQIRVHGERNMIIEIRNSSKKDYAEAAQWTEHSGATARWYFFTEKNRNGKNSAIVKIRNVNSGKMLNVPNNSGRAGNNLIQYHEDGTKAEEFYIESVEDRITGAIWTRSNWNANGLRWSGVKDTKANRKKYYTPINFYKNGYIWYPNANSSNTAYLATVIWANDNLQKKILQYRYPPKNGITQIKEALGDIATEFVIDNVFNFGAIPSGDIPGLISVIMAGQNNNQWYLMEKAFQQYSNVRIEIYYYFKNGSWGVSCVPLVNDQADYYWNGSRRTISTSQRVWGTNDYVSGNIEYFFK